MKLNPLALFLFAALSTVSATSQSLKAMKEGEIVYTFSMVSNASPGANKEIANQMDIKYNSKMVVMTTTMAAPMDGVSGYKVFYDRKKEKASIFLEYEGTKYVTTLSTKERKRAKTRKALNSLMVDSMTYRYMPSDSEIKICGYACRKYSRVDKWEKAEVYASDSARIPPYVMGGLSNIFDFETSRLPGVKGRVLKYISTITLDEKEMKTTYMITKVSDAPVSKSEFIMPVGYKKIGFDDLKELTGRKKM